MCSSKQCGFTASEVPGHGVLRAAGEGRLSHASRGETSEAGNEAWACNDLVTRFRPSSRSKKFSRAQRAQPFHDLSTGFPQSAESGDAIVFDSGAEDTENAT